MLAAPKLTVFPELFPQFLHFFYDMPVWMNTVGKYAIVVIIPIIMISYL
jgi:hypothetical protein